MIADTQIARISLFVDLLKVILKVFYQSLEDCQMLKWWGTAGIWAVPGAVVYPREPGSGGGL